MHTFKQSKKKQKNKHVVFCSVWRYFLKGKASAPMSHAEARRKVVAFCGRGPSRDQTKTKTKTNMWFSVLSRGTQRRENPRKSLSHAETRSERGCLLRAGPSRNKKKALNCCAKRLKQVLNFWPTGQTLNKYKLVCIICEQSFKLLASRPNF